MFMPTLRVAGLFQYDRNLNFVVYMSITRDRLTLSLEILSIVLVQILNGTDIDLTSLDIKVCQCPNHYNAVNENIPVHQIWRWVRVGREEYENNCKEKPQHCCAVDPNARPAKRKL